jgi:hypothetical protein
VNAILKPELSALPDASNDRLVGIVENLSIEEYHSGPGISKTGLDSIDANAAIYYALHLDPQRPAPPVRAGQLEGSLTHCAVLEPDEFAKRYVTLPKDAPRRPPMRSGMRRTRATRAAPQWRGGRNGTPRRAAQPSSRRINTTSRCGRPTASAS